MAPPLSSPSVDPTAAAPRCPRCQKSLVDPHGLGWCQACGYCRSLEEGQAALPLAKADAPPAKPAVATQFGTAAKKFPLWVVGLVAGMVIVAAGSYFLQRSLQVTPLQRALWTSIQVLVGLVIMVAGQTYALVCIAPEDAALQSWDAIIPFRLYGLVFKRLPRMCLTVLCGGWGLTLVLAALIGVGGLGHLLKYIPKSRESETAKWN